MKRPLLLLILLSSAMVLSAQEGARRLYSLAEERFQREDDPIALEYYRDIIEEYPLSSHAPDAQFRVGQIFYRTGRYGEADAQFRRVDQRYRTTRFLDELPFWRGLTSHALGAYGAAADHLSLYLSTDDPPLEGEALLYLGLAQKAIGDSASAMETLEKLINDPDAAPGGYILSLLGNLYLESARFRSLGELLEGRDVRALDSPWREQLLFLSAERIRTEEPEKAADLYGELTGTPGQIGALSYQRLFGILLVEGDVTPMQELLDRAERDLQGEPELLSEFWMRIGIAFFNEGSYESSELYLRRVYNLTPQDEPSHPLIPLYLARIAQREGQYTRAQTLLEEFIEKGGDSGAELLFTLGELKTRQGEWTSALEIWKEMGFRYPLSSLISLGSYYHGYCLFRLSRPEEALEALRPLIDAGGSAAEGLSGEYRLSLIRLLGNLYGRTGRFDMAAEAWREYGRLAFRDPLGRRELLRTLFLGGYYEEVMAEALTLKRDEAFRRSSPDVPLLASYISGLAALSLKRYDTALEDLMPLGEADLEAVGWGALFPHILYYRGWAHYRSARFQRALEDFSSLTDRIASMDGQDPVDPLLYNGYYLAGWCAFQLKDYHAAAELFLTHAKMGSNPVKGRLMGARSLRGEGKKSEAVEVLDELLTLYPEDLLTRDALFEKGEVLAEMGRPESASEAYMALYDAAPGATLSEQGLFRRGEVYMAAQLWEEAQGAFYLYRRLFPRGDYADAAHYWGGETAARRGEPFGAVLLWERLAEEYPASSFRGGALWKSAQVYQERGDYEKALSLVEELVRIRPDEARGFGAAAKGDELRYLMAGNSPEEALLRARINSLGGAEDPEGRETVLELARILLFKGGEAREEARLLLEEVIFYREEDLSRAARAQFYMGEYHQRAGEPEKAREAFLSAASMNPADRDLMAMSIFRAAEVAQGQGKTSTVKALVERLEANFPQSTWAEEGRTLLEENNEQ